jgi:hypothetical protein
MAITPFIGTIHCFGAEPLSSVAGGTEGGSNEREIGEEEQKWGRQLVPPR